MEETKAPKDKRVHKLRKELRNWKVESSRLKAQGNAKRVNDLMERERGLLAWLKINNPKRYKRKYRTYKRMQEAKDWFDHLDFDSSGEIDENELLVPLISMGFAHSVEEVRELIAHVDEDGSGEIGFEEFWEILNDRDSDNAFKKLHRALDSGELGDHNLIGVETLLSSYRRKVLFSALMSYGKQDADADTLSTREKAKFKRSINALDKVFIRRDWEKTHPGEATEASSSQETCKETSLKRQWHERVNRMKARDVRRAVRKEQGKLSILMKSKERQLHMVPRTKQNCPGKNLYSIDSASTILSLPPYPGAKEMLEATRAKLRKERKEHLARTKPPPGVNPVLAKLLKSQPVKSQSYKPTDQSLASVSVDRSSLPQPVKLIIDRTSVQTSVHNANVGIPSLKDIKEITCNYESLDRFQRRYAHVVQ